MVDVYNIDPPWIEVKEPVVDYGNWDSLNKLTYEIIGICFEVHNELGMGFLEIVYKDAIQYELKKKGIVFEREKKFEIKYKDTILPHFYYADFVVENKIIVELKAQQGEIDAHFKQVINYLAVSKCPLGLVINFGEPSLKYKRVILTKNKK